MGIINKLRGVDDKSSPPEYQPPLTQSECELLLAILGESSFKGRDVQYMYDLIKKIQDMHEFYIKRT